MTKIPSRAAIGCGLACLLTACLGLFVWLVYREGEPVRRLRAALDRLADIERRVAEDRDAPAEARRKLDEERSASWRELHELIGNVRAVGAAEQSRAGQALGSAIREVPLTRPGGLRMASRLFRQAAGLLTSDDAKALHRTLRDAYRDSVADQFKAVGADARALDEIDRLLSEARDTLREEMAEERERLEKLRQDRWLEAIRTVAREDPGEALRLLGDAARVGLPEREYQELLEAWLVRQVRPRWPELARLDPAAAGAVWRAVALSRQRRERVYVVVFPTGALYAENGILQVLKIDRAKP